jgi:Ni/Co efflux regulator RcnB
MKRLVLTLVAGAFGSLLVLPLAHAADYEDMSNDASTIRNEQRDIHQDKREERQDLENGNLGAAAREQADINRDRANMDANKEDLNRDLHENEYARHHHDDDND